LEDRRRFLMKRRHRVVTRALAALLVLAAPVGAGVARAEGGGQNQFPCSSTILRAGALLPELVPDQQLLTDDHVVWRDPQTGQFLLAFSAGIMNLGAGTLNVVGYRDPVAGSIPDPNTMPAYQRIFHADGTCDELPVGTMEYHDVHHHWHLEGVMKYELLNAKGKPVKPNTKVAFCLADVAVVDSSLPGFPTAPAFNGCDPNRSTTYVNTGTSIGWEDIYDKMLFGQNFDVTDLMNRPQAQYFIRQTVDADGILFEQDDSNNTTGIWVTLGIGVPYSIGGPRPGV
jgi:Lysyl oxidase